jgi:adenylate cyclase
VNADHRGADERLSLEELARSASVDETLVKELTRLTILEPDGRGYRLTDVYRVRFGALLASSGIDLEDAARAIAAGIVSFGDLETMFPEPAVATTSTHGAFALELGIDVDTLMNIRLATGLTTRRVEDPIRSDDARILRHIVTVAEALGSVDLAATVGRMYGDRVERIASAALGLYRERIDRPWLETVGRLDPEASRHGSEVGRETLDRTEQLLLVLYRRAIDDGLLAGWLETTEVLMARHGYLERRPRRVPGIAFVDLTGFTTLTEAQGDEAGMAVATRLLSEAQRIAASSGIRIVKLLGDGVMLHADEPGRLVEATLELVRSLAAPGRLRAHAGVHAGPVIEQDGDFFGHTVNVASRIASEASAGEVLASGPAVEGLADTVRLTELPTRELRGVRDGISLFRIEPL